MADPHPWRSFLALPSDSRAKTLGMALLVSAASALVVSAAAVLLEPRIDANRAAERQARLDEMIASLPGLADLIRQTGADTLETVVVNLADGTRAEDPPQTVSMEALAADPETSTELAPTEDLAGIGRRPDLAEIFVLRSGDRIDLAIFPVYGKGYQSTIRAYVALEGDLNTVAGFTVTEQGETPGLGAKIADPAWQQLWPGKQLAGEDGTIRISVVRGGARSEYEVDGITGATRTSNGVSGMMQFWFGPDGYGPVIDALRSGEIG